MNTLKIYCGETIPENFTGLIEILDKKDDSLYARYWYKEGKYHQVNGPAVEYANGDKYWYKEGKFHRLDGPAIGCSTWYIDGVKYKGSKILETLLLRSVFLSINKNGKYNIPWLSFLTEQGITEFPILPNYPFTTKCLEFLQSLSITLSTPPLIKE